MIASHPHIPLNAHTASELALKTSIARQLTGLSYSPIVGQIQDPMLALVYKLVQEGNRAEIARASRTNIDLFLLLESIQYQESKYRANTLKRKKNCETRRKKREARQPSEKLSIGQIKQVKVTQPIASTAFTGQYPQPAQKQCNSWCHVEQIGTSKLKLHKAEARLWRPKVVDGMTFNTCPHCLFIRTRRFCLQIEREFNEHSNLVYAIIPTANKNKLIAQFRKMRQQTQTVVYLCLPKGNKVLVIHNQQKAVSKLTTRRGQLLVGNSTPIPTERPILLSLIEMWAQTPKEQQVSSSNGWGKEYQGTKGDGRINTIPSPTESETDEWEDLQEPSTHESTTQSQETKPNTKIAFQNQLKLLSALIKRHIEINNKGEFELSIRRLLHIAEEEGLTYKILVGEGWLIEQSILDKHGNLITPKEHRKKGKDTMSLKRDKPQLFGFVEERR